MYVYIYYTVYNTKHENMSNCLLYKAPHCGLNLATLQAAVSPRAKFNAPLAIQGRALLSTVASALFLACELVHSAAALPGFQSPFYLTFFFLFLIPPAIIGFW